MPSNLKAQNSKHISKKEIENVNKKQKRQPLYKMKKENNSRTTQFRINPNFYCKVTSSKI